MLDLIGAAEAAKILGVEIQRISRWRRAGKLPLAYAELRATPVWLRSQIEAFHAGTQHPDMDKVPLVGTAEAAELLEVDKGQITRWRKHPPRSGVAFPAPVAVVMAGPVWKREDIEQYQEHIVKRHRKEEAA